MSRREEIEKYVGEYLEKLDMRSWETRIRIARDQHPEDLECHAEVMTSITYRRLNIVVYPHFWVDRRSENERRRTILHELSHAVVEPLKTLLLEGSVDVDQIDEATERVTEHLTAIVWLLVHGRSELTVEEE